MRLISIPAILVTFATLFSYISFAQGLSSCDGERYKTAVFDDVDVVRGVKFGEGTTIGGNDQELFMDIYTPKGDDETARPVIVLAFGGSFVSGDRLQLQPICTELAKKGYVTVSMDYRLYDLPLFPFPTTEEMIDVVVKSMLDVEAAIVFLDEDSRGDNTYGIDADWIYIGGVSAGSIATSNYAMLDASDSIGAELKVALENNDAIDGIGNSEPRVNIAGLLNYSGALRSSGFIDAGDPPVISFHDDGDEVVPYDGREIELLGQKIIYVEGSSLIDSAALAAGVQSELHTFVNSSGHVSYFNQPSTTTDVLNKSAVFMHDMICEGFTSVNDLKQILAVSAFPNPMDNFITLSGLTGNETISISNIAGKLMDNYSIESSEGLYVLNGGDLVPGIYFIQVKTESTIQTLRVIKQ